MGRLGWVLVVVVVGCGPRVGQPGEGGGGSEGAGSSDGGSESSQGSAAESTSSASGPGEDEEPPDPKYDVSRPDLGPLQYACEFPPPSSCEPAWSQDQELARSPLGAQVEFHPGSSSVVIAPSYPADASYIASFAFELPCPYSLGAPEAYMDRFEVDAVVEVQAWAEFEFSDVATYPAVADVQFINACLHLQVHSIAVGSTPIAPVDGPSFAWPELLRTGYVAVEP